MPKVNAIEQAFARGTQCTVAVGGGGKKARGSESINPGTILTALDAVVALIVSQAHVGLKC